MMVSGSFSTLSLTAKRPKSWPAIFSSRFSNRRWHRLKCTERCSHKWRRSAAMRLVRPSRLTQKVCLRVHKFDDNVGVGFLFVVRVVSLVVCTLSFNNRHTYTRRLMNDRMSPHPPFHRHRSHHPLLYFIINSKLNFTKQLHNHIVVHPARTHTQKTHTIIMNATPTRHSFAGAASKLCRQISRNHRQTAIAGLQHWAWCRQ